MRTYLVEFNGDLPTKRKDCEKMLCFNSLDEALKELKKMFIPLAEDDDGYRFPDPEDDRIVVWEADTETHSVWAVWAFCGWHWSLETLAVPSQGKLPGMDKSLYELVMDDY